jgi:multicomponent Na+:H+ antiporter subunit B
VRRKNTELLSVVARKLSPFIFLFGFYLVSFGHVSPGGGFQGGVVIASGMILLVLSERQRGSDLGQGHMGLGARILTAGESIAFGLLLTLGIVGIVTAGFFLASPLKGVGFVLALNILIGIKVAAGVSLIAVALFREEET